ncbi:hypothetical protein JHK87_027457 [Glycine soja]|nr:hypothetical protein JHK87_027457 [Glycine soja]
MAGDEGVIRKQGQQSHSDRQQQIEAKLDQVDTFAKGGGGRGKTDLDPRKDEEDRRHTSTDYLVAYASQRLAWAS